MNNRAVTHSHTLPDGHRKAVVDMDDGSILTLLSSPTSIESVSPRITAVGHTDTRAPSVTSPRTTADGWMYAEGWIVGIAVQGNYPLNRAWEIS